MKRVEHAYLRSRHRSRVRPPAWLAGVCGGAAYHLQVPVWAVRTIFAALAFLAGAGVILYAVLWLVIPREGSARALVEKTTLNTDGIPLFFDHQSPAAPLLRGSPNTQLLLAGGASLLVAVLLGAGPAILGLEWSTIAAWVVLVGGIALVWSQVPRLSGWELNQAMGFIVLGVVLMVAGSVRLLADYAPAWTVNLSFGVGLVLLLAVMAALTPVAIKLVRDLTRAKAREAREAERADIAAHLHDSVLQTLTLIRAGAEDPRRVRSLALTQERELRTWLYTAAPAPVGESAVEALRDQASEVEAVHGVPIEVVTVGDCAPGPVERAAIAAAGEAMTNASKHGHPPISVFQESGDTTLEIYVKDSGPGFSEESIPEDRHGFRHSIRGRVERVGGQVEVRHRGGTEIRIRVPRGGNSDGNSRPGN